MLRAALICLFFILRHPMWSATGQGSQNSRKKETDHTEENDLHRTKKTDPSKEPCRFVLSEHLNQFE